MTILKTRTVWKREPAPRKYERVNRLSPEQEARVRAAIEVLRVRIGTLRGVARAMGVNPDLVTRAARKGGKPSPGLAIHVAALAKVPVDDILQGRFPRPGACPMCGRCE